MHPEWNFIHGHDVQKKGFEGQASIYNEANTFALPVMYKFCPSGARFFTDGDSEARKIILDTLWKIPTDKPIIILRNIGCGCSRMRELAPRLHWEMMLALKDISSPNYDWNLYA